MSANQPTPGPWTVHVDYGKASITIFARLVEEAFKKLDA